MYVIQLQITNAQVPARDVLGGIAAQDGFNSGRKLARVVWLGRHWGRRLANAIPGQKIRSYAVVN